MTHTTEAGRAWRLSATVAGRATLALSGLLWVVMVLARTRLAIGLGVEGLATRGGLARAAALQVLLVLVGNHALVLDLIRRAHDAAAGALDRLAGTRAPRLARARARLVVRRLVPGLVVSADAARLERHVALVRVLVGVVVLHHALSVFGVGMLAGDPSRATGLLVAGAAIVLGALTPVALLSLMVVPYPAPSLGNHVLHILVWGLLLLGAGRTHSLDALARRAPALRKASALLYAFAPERGGARRVARVRLLLVTLFSGVCLRAMADHAWSAPWRSCEILQAVLTNPYFTDHHRTFVVMRDAAPGTFDAFCRVSLVVQAAWETLLLPCMLWRPTRLFAIAQGWAFQLISLLVLNLGSLPVYELTLWLLLFGLRSRARSTAPVAPAGERERDPGLVVLGACAALIFALYPVDLPRQGCTLPRALYRVLGQEPVDVFNALDLATPSGHLVLVEEGPAPRVVQFEDIDGGRLDLLRNPFVLYAWSIGWRRETNERRYGPGRTPAPATVELARRVALLDAAGLPARDRTYRAYAFARTPGETAPGAPTGWSAASLVASWPVAVSALDVEAAQRSTILRLPPGQWWSRERAARTLEQLSRLESPGE